MERYDEYEAAGSIRHSYQAEKPKNTMLGAPKRDILVHLRHSTLEVGREDQIWILQKPAGETFPSIILPGRLSVRLGDSI